MSYVTAAKPGLSLASMAARPFVAFWNFLILLAEANPRMKAAEQLNLLTDEQLAERGTTRSDELRRIFAGYLHL